MPYKMYRDSTDKAAEKIASSGECFVTGDRIDAISEFAEKTMKLNLKSYDIKSVRNILRGISLSSIVSEGRAAKYEE
ncbi:MAG: hypothetical protein ACREBU_14055 [Nitrososphaera sp.]